MEDRRTDQNPRHRLNATQLVRDHSVIAGKSLETSIPFVLHVPRLNPRDNVPFHRTVADKLAR